MRNIEIQYLVNKKSWANGLYLFDLNFIEIKEQFKGKIQVQQKYSNKNSAQVFVPS